MRQSNRSAVRELLLYAVIASLTAAGGMWIVAPPASAQQGQQAAGTKPAPDLENVSYGPHERNVLDLWKAKSDAPTPLVVYIHGGGFRGGVPGDPAGIGTPRSPDPPG